MQYAGKASRGTIKDHPGFDVNNDSEVLRKAMKGLGTDEDSIINLLTNRSSAQRKQMCKAYKTLFGKDLVEDLKSELGGKFEKLIVGMMKTRLEYDVSQLRDALKGAGTNEKCLIEILASRTNAEIHEIKAAYKEEYGKDLEEDIVNDTSGHFGRMLVILLQGNRDQGRHTEEASVKQDAECVLWGSVELSCVTNLIKFSHCIAFFLVFDQYMKISGYQIEESISSETSGNLANALLAVVKCVRDVPEYFAESLHNSMKGAGTDDDTLIRIMISRSEVDMLDIREKFRQKFGKSLYIAIKKDTSGDYRNALLKLCGGGVGE
uniref:Annexin n=1 Tax=Callorhinchus milii TaxID=7868 RepID=A0A4W3HY16_CALMI